MSFGHRQQQLCPLSMDNNNGLGPWTTTNMPLVHAQQRTQLCPVSMDKYNYELGPWTQQQCPWSMDKNYVSVLDKNYVSVPWTTTFMSLVHGKLQQLCHWPMVNNYVLRPLTTMSLVYGNNNNYVLGPWTTTTTMSLVHGQQQQLCP